jgi:hypothetical protein
MVSDIILAALVGGVIGVVGTLLGTLLEPISARFARKSHQEQLRRTLYSDLIIKLHRALGMYTTYKQACEDAKLKYRNHPNKLEIYGPIAFNDEVTAQADYYQLTAQEFTPLAYAYYRLRTVVNFVNQFGTHSLEIDQAKEKLVVIEREIRRAVYAINRAFKENVHTLEKIDNGILLKEWRELCRELLIVPHFKALLVTEPQFKKLDLRKILQDCLESAEKPIESEEQEISIEQ